MLATLTLKKTLEKNIIFKNVKICLDDGSDIISMSKFSILCKNSVTRKRVN